MALLLRPSRECRGIHNMICSDWYCGPEMRYVWSELGARDGERLPSMAFMR